MATVVEVTQKKPTITDLTVKLSASEARDLKVMIDAYYKNNYGTYYTNYRDEFGPHRVLTSILDGKTDAAKVKTAASPF
jgi:hypothetical protein